MLRRLKSWMDSGPRSQGVLSPAEGYRRWSADYGDTPNALQQLEAEAVERLLPDVRGHRVLDLGCGKGRLAQRTLELGAAQAVGADLSPAMLAASDVFGGAKVTASVDRRLPFRDASFDTVICALVLGHVADLAGALQAMASALRPGGHLVISDFHPYATLRGWERTFVDAANGETWAIEQHLHLFSTYVDVLGRNGLIVEAAEEPMWESSPVVFALRARKTTT